MFFCFFISKNIYLVFISGIEQDAKLMDIAETSQTLYGILCKLVMSQYLKIEQYQTFNLHLFTLIFINYNL